jgi:hypothetical protein
MDTYTYSYKADSKQEPIGRVKATGLYEAREQIAQIKQLTVSQLDELFEIKIETGHGYKIRQTKNF